MRKSLKGACLSMGLLMAGSVTAAPVHTTLGDVTGVTVDGVETFKGIPFAAPPVGDLRWRAPQPAKPWDGTLKADQYGHDCMQVKLSWDTNFMAKEPSEDCLVLNIWRPAKAASKKLPVMVWIHGGAFLNGGSSLAIYDGKSFARDGVVFVSLNYRMGRFGFFGFTGLSKENADGGLLGNYGYLDQIAALKWVKANIAAFGGDPDQVTVFGESAGGGSVLMLLTSPEAKGLFNRAIVESGGGRGPIMGPRHLNKDQPNAPSAETLGANFARKMGLQGTDADILKALRSMTSDQIADGLNGDNMWKAADTYGGPMIDGRIVVESPKDAFLGARSPRVPVMIGVTSADMGFSYAKTKDEAFASFGALANQARAAYDPDGTMDLKTLNMRIGRDRIMAEPARFVAKTRAAQDIPSYHYRFSYVADSKEKEWTRGVPHFEEIVYVFETAPFKYGAAFTARDTQMMKTVHSHWVNFAKGDMKAWPAYDPKTDLIMDYQRDGQARLVPDPDKAMLDVNEALANMKP